MQVDRALIKKLPIHEIKYLNSELRPLVSSAKHLMIAMYVMILEKFIVLETPEHVALSLNEYKIDGFKIDNDHTRLRFSQILEVMAALVNITRKTIIETYHNTTEKEGTRYVYSLHTTLVDVL